MVCIILVWTYSPVSRVEFANRDSFGVYCLGNLEAWEPLRQNAHGDWLELSEGMLRFAALPRQSHHQLMSF